MMTIANYQIDEQIYDGSNSIVYRAHRLTDKKSIILKVLRDLHPPPSKLARFKQEYEIGHILNLPGVVSVYSLEIDSNRWLITMEDFGGASLSSLALAGKLKLAQFLNLAIDISQILGQVHQQNIIHKDINPANIVLNLQTNQVKLIDFGISTIFSRENLDFCNPNALNGTLGYISPEQTGRMNRIVDYRTDFYSLGVTFYELLTGQLPYLETDTLAIVHSHIARQPIPPHRLNSQIPEVISNIVLKLMAKNAEDRYQSAYGLQYDLEKCLTQLQKTGGIESFLLAERDFSSKFVIPQKLYGRHEQFQILYQAFERVTASSMLLFEKNTAPTQLGVNRLKTGVELVLVTGPSGVGKTELVNEIRRPITAKRGYFIEGQFEQYQRDIPYSAWIQAFTHLVNQLLTESVTQVATWKEKILQAVGNNGKVLTDIIPALTLLIGEQPVIPKLDVKATQNRFNYVFRNFIKAISHKTHPLVIFIDNFQWADFASINLLTTIITDVDNQYLLLIGAYRDNELNKSHPFSIAINNIYNYFSTNQNQHYTPIHTIALKNLNIEDVSNLIADTLHSNQQDVKPLANLVYKKTQGNAFFVRQFLKSLYIEKNLVFNRVQQTTLNTMPVSYKWQWNLPEIEKMTITDNVVDLMASRIQKLPDNTQEILKIAACIGIYFDLHILITITQQSEQESRKHLQDALIEGFIWQTKSNPTQNEYKFAHDRIHQAIYSRIPQDNKKQIHLQIAKLLLQTIPADQYKDRIFDIINQWNIALDLVENDDDKIQLARLNAMGGEKAKLTTAYEPAFNYFKTGINLLNTLKTTNTWVNHYPLTLFLYTNGSQTAYLSGHFKQMDNLIEVALQNSKSLLDKVDIYQVKIEAYLAQNKLQQAIETGLEILNLLDVKIPTQPTQIYVSGEAQEVWAILSRTQTSTLFNLPQMTNPIKLAAIRIINSIFAATYLANSVLKTLLVIKQIKLFIKYGNAPESAFAYANYGLLLCGEQKNIPDGYCFGQLALDLLQKFNNKKEQAKVMVNVNFFIKHWREPVKLTLKALLEAYQIGLETGESIFAAYALHNYCIHSYFSGQNLVELEKEMTTYGQVLTQLQQERTLRVNRLYRQVILNLIKAYDFPSQLSGEVYDEEKMLAIHKEANDETAICVLYFNKLNLAYLFKNYQKAIAYATIAEDNLSALTSTVIVPAFYFYDSLVRLSVYFDSSTHQKTQILSKVMANLKKMENWAKYSPVNYRHKFYLVKAKFLEITAEYQQAREYYEQAIELAQKYGYLNEEALARELTGEFYLEQGLDELAEFYLQKSHQAYKNWGALAKVSDMEERYPRFLVINQTYWSTHTTSSSTALDNVNSAEFLDVNSIVKASQTLSSEIILDKLLKTIIQIALQNAGAQHGLLILEEDGQWFIEVKGTTDIDQVIELQSIPLETTQVTDVPMGIINYVARTRRNVVLNNATQEGQFTQDNYILYHHPKSILCVPLINQSKIIGILYLENNLTTYAFTPQRIEIISLLGTQAAISITNARAIAARADQERLRLEQERLHLEQEHLRLQNELLEERSQELARLNTDKDKFFSIVSHDLRAPFTALLGGTNFMLESLDSLDSLQLHRLVENIHTSAKAAHSLLENLLTWSRLQRGRMSHNPDKVELGLLAQNTVILLNQAAVQKNIELLNYIPPELFIFADRYMVETVIRNLSSNALKFTPQGGQVIISIELNNQDDSNYHQLEDNEFIVVSISDTGIGINQKDIQKLFKIESHYSTLGTAQEHGTGLGLIICCEMIEKNGGRIWIESQEGQGTTVYFTVVLHQDTNMSSIQQWMQQTQLATLETTTELSTKSFLQLDPSAIPSEEKLTELWNLAMRGDIQNIKTQLIKLEQTNPQLTLFINELKELAEAFDDEAIAIYIEQCMASVGK